MNKAKISKRVKSQMIFCDYSSVNKKAIKRYQNYGRNQLHQHISSQDAYLKKKMPLVQQRDRPRKFKLEVSE